MLIIYILISEKDPKMISAEDGIFRTRDFPKGLWNEANKYRMRFHPLPLIFAKTVYRKKKLIIYKTV